MFRRFLPIWRFPTITPRRNSQIILGLDPGLASTGYGFIGIERGRAGYLEHGVIQTSPRWTFGQRLSFLFDEICRLIKVYQPQGAGLESLYFAKKLTSAIPVAQAKGVLLLALEQNQVPVEEFSPPQLKQGLTGSGRAEKEQVWEMVRMILGLAELPGPDHATDALAAAICFYHRRQADEKGMN
ncbi:MAG: crossover junction endodeoxyribonuclease RuvC [Spirochaetales bacterium]|jgi:crossover junction endodeoxyribonuclease RuvC|nr:crossover junction endodeoxyribonuclease RuvC [Spirochaetales bacterium]